MGRLQQGCVGLLLSTVALQASAVSGISFTAGYWSATQATAARVAAQWDWISRPKNREAALDIYIDTSFAYLHSDRTNTRHDHLYIWAASPVVRFSIKDSRIEPFAEVGIGASYVTNTRFATKELSTNFQFEDRAGLGVRLYEKYEIAAHYRHYSNCSIKMPNNGIDLYTLTAAYRF